MTGSPQAGWYTDPTEQKQYRWWDGSTWTEHVHIPPAAAPQNNSPFAQPSSPPTTTGSTKHRPIQLRRTISQTFVAAGAALALVAIWFAYDSFDADEASELVIPFAAAAAGLAIAAMILRRRTRLLAVPVLVIALGAVGITLLADYDDPLASANASSSADSTKIAPALSSGSLPLPHFGD